jgi:hypothetical protein
MYQLPLDSLLNAIKTTKQQNNNNTNPPGCSVRDRHWFSNLVDVDVRTGDHDLDDPLAIGTLAVAGDFKRLTCLREWETIGTVNTPIG